MKFCSNIFSFFPTVRFATLRYISKHTSNSIIIDKKKTAFPVDTLMFLERARVHTQYVCVLQNGDSLQIILWKVQQMYSLKRHFVLLNLDYKNVFYSKAKTYLIFKSKF